MTHLRTLEETQRLANAHSKRRHPKRHSVNRERSREARRRALEAKVAREANDKRFRVYKALVRAYWAGEIDSHPARC